MMPVQTWVFRARCTRVVDGDTLDVVIDQGMHTQRTERVRLLGVNAPELHGATREAGIVARSWVDAWIVAAGLGTWPLVIQTYKADVFGRYLATIWRGDKGEELNASLVTAGMAAPA